MALQSNFKAMKPCLKNEEKIYCHVTLSLKAMCEHGQFLASLLTLGMVTALKLQESDALIRSWPYQSVEKPSLKFFFFLKVLLNIFVNIK